VTVDRSHPLRRALHDEVHARPPLSLPTPSRLTCLALMSSADEVAKEIALLGELAVQHGLPSPKGEAGHCVIEAPGFRLKWERHTEYSRYVISVDGAGSRPFAEPATASLPRDWLERLPGQMLYAGHAEVVPGGTAWGEGFATTSNESFGGRALVGSLIAGGLATVLTDFRIDEQGFSRLLLIDRGMTPAQCGRAVQALLEVDTYRLLALLAFPVARELSPQLARDERELSSIANELVHIDKTQEPVLLERLTRLQAEIERYEADHHYRFGAAEAYHEIVQRRLEQLREERVDSLQTLQEFMERRLAPAMNTCVAVMARMESLSQRVTRATQLLSTRIEITREGQNQQLLESMNQRAAAQLRLQGTVEGLSVAAVTYYIVGLIGYLAQGLDGLSFLPSAGVITATSIPVVAILVALGVRRIRRAVERQVDHQMERRS
jgi:uncharacterized membrane-anchored protein